MEKEEEEEKPAAQQQPRTYISRPHKDGGVTRYCLLDIPPHKLPFREKENGKWAECQLPLVAGGWNRLEPDARRKHVAAYHTFVGLDPPGDQQAGSSGGEDDDYDNGGGNDEAVASAGNGNDKKNYCYRPHKEGGVTRYSLLDIPPHKLHVQLVLP